VALALAILLAGAALTAILLQPLSRVIGRPFEWFFGAEGLLGRANLGRDRARTGLTVGALIIALSAVVTLGVVANSAGATADRWVSSVLPGGYAIRYALPVDIDTFQPGLEATTGTAAVTPIADFSAVMQPGSEGKREASVAGIDPTVFSATGSLIFTIGDRDDAFRALQEGGAVLVPEPVARRDTLGVGSTVQLSKPGADAHTFTVAGITPPACPAIPPNGAPHQPRRCPRALRRQRGRGLGLKQPSVPEEFRRRCKCRPMVCGRLLCVWPRAWSVPRPRHRRFDVLPCSRW
jgi:hypothetical protein